MASSMAMTLAGCPSPFWPSTSPVAISSRATVGSAAGLMKPRRVHSTYFGSMPMPCESTPRRSVRTIRSAARRAFFGDILRASSTETMNSARRSWGTTTGSSAMSGPQQAADKGPSASLAPSAARSWLFELRGEATRRGLRQSYVVSRAESTQPSSHDGIRRRSTRTAGRRLASGPFSPACGFFSISLGGQSGDLDA